MIVVMLKVFSAVLIAVGIYAKVAKESGIHSIRHNHSSLVIKEACKHS